MRSCRLVFLVFRFPNPFNVSRKKVVIVFIHWVNAWLDTLLPRSNQIVAFSDRVGGDGTSRNKAASGGNPLRSACRPRYLTILDKNTYQQLESYHKKSGRFSLYGAGKESFISDYNHFAISSDGYLSDSIPTII